MMTRTRGVLIVEARFYADLADQLYAGAAQVLTSAGVPSGRRAVPGCFELPAAIRFAIGESPATCSFEGFIALGCVIRGETDHYDHICREVARALMDLSVAFSMPLGFGVLTCNTYEQARARAAVDQKNKGADAAIACLRMMELKRLSGAVSA
jgi:6,7-dimethyl-8-ribityllumazine synthase